MKLRSSYLRAVSLSMMVAGFLGLMRTRDGALHLLEKNKALMASGHVALPGTGHLETMASWSPALAGALFFALALGLGYGSASYLIGYVGRFLPNFLKPVAAVPLLALPTMAFYRGEWDTGLSLILISLIPVTYALRAKPLNRTKLKPAFIGFLSLLILLAGFIPWFKAPQGPFAKIRDSVLLESNTLRPISDFYYRWTLYPAEAIKPVDLSTQPIALAGPEVGEEFCRDAWQLGIVCLPLESAAYDFKVKREGDSTLLMAGKSSMEWDSKNMARNSENIKTFADSIDRARILRRATSISLLFLTPLAVFVPLAFLCVRVGKKPVASLIAAGVIALIISFPSKSSKIHEVIPALRDGTATNREIAAALADTDPTLRLYGALAAAKAPLEHTEALYRGLKDPIINVRYNSALALGGVRTQEAREKLLSIMNSDEEWYVKFRAYQALARLGWRP